MTASQDPRDPGTALPPRPLAALAGIIAGGLGVGLSELFAGFVPGAPSPILAIGNLIIKLQPAGAKQLVVDLFGEADKLVLNGAILIVALAIGGGLGLVARRSAPTARTGFAALGLGVLAAAWYADPAFELVPAAINGAIGSGAAMLTIEPLVNARRRRATAEMPDFDRRRFIGLAVSLAGVAAVGGTAGRLLLDRRAATAQSVPAIPAPGSTVPPLPDGAELDVTGITRLVTPNPEFYRIDTALLIPRPDVTTWSLSVDGMVDRPFSVDYAELLAMPLVEHYVTIACVSNEVGGRLVGNAKWRGVPLRAVLDRAGVREGATQIVGRSVDGFTAGFPTAWVMDDPNREALVAVAMNDAQLPPEHGFPARLIVPGLYGYVSATKWLSNITLTRLEDFDAYWVPLGWAKEAPILTQSRIDVPRSGDPLTAGPVAVAGVAWAPDRGIARVEVQVDGESWAEAEISAPISDATWVQWLYPWEAPSGDHTLRVRATDGTGAVQTDHVTRPPPDGARGHHTIQVHVG